MGAKKTLLGWALKNRAILSPGHRMIEWPFLLGYIPFIREKFSWLSRAGSSITYLPVNRELATEGVALPSDIIAELITMTPYRVIMDKCLCRFARDCKDHPHDIGCLFMGEDALGMPVGASRRVGVDEALAHLEKAKSAGLIPFAGKVRFDNSAFLIPDRKKLLSICFCCPCCCMMAYYRHLPVEQLDSVFPRIQGLTITVTDECNGCGICVEKCYIGAISIVDGRAVHSEKCRGCGRCAGVCNRNAVTIRIDNPGYRQEILDRLGSMVNIK